MRFAGLVFLAAMGTEAVAFGGPCTADSLSVYIALGATGCQVGPFTADSFSYSLVAATVTIPASAITVTPMIGSGTYGLRFSSPDFSVTGNDFARYLLAYTWDPGDIRSLEDVLDPPMAVFPGLAMITTDVCEDSAFAGSTCPTTDVTLSVFTNGITSNLTSLVGFTPGIGIAGIRDLIELDGNGASAQFDGFSNILGTPEPSTLAGGLFALATIVLRRLRK